MASIKIAAIMRAAAYSPNHIGNDAAILNLTCEQLRKRGCEVKVYSEEQLIAGNVTEEYVINMCRDRRSLPILQAMEDKGTLVINSAYGIENCIRERMARILIGSGIPYPESIMVDTNQTVTSRLDAMGISRAWIKKGEMFASHKEDVTYVRHSAEAQEMLQEYFLRGIRRAVISGTSTGSSSSSMAWPGRNTSITPSRCSRPPRAPAPTDSTSRSSGAHATAPPRHSTSWSTVATLWSTTTGRSP